MNSVEELQEIIGSILELEEVVDQLLMQKEGVRYADEHDWTPQGCDVRFWTSDNWWDCFITIEEIFNQLEFNRFDKALEGR
jgi:hypothetical protein